MPGSSESSIDPLTASDCFTLRLATRHSRLALRQTEMTEAALRLALGPGLVLQRLEITTSGDQRRDWALSQQGGTGLFTKELENALLGGRADLAVHSAKDLPTMLAPGTVLAGFLPREDPSDVLVLQEGIQTPATIATGSPRRRAQLARLFPAAVFSELRGNVETRLEKTARGDAQATVLALAGLRRLGIHSWPGLQFRILTVEESVPAPGQGAIAWQTRSGEEIRLAVASHEPTSRAVSAERALLTRLGGGCHSAVAACCRGGRLLVFHEKTGLMIENWPESDVAAQNRLLDKLSAYAGV